MSLPEHAPPRLVETSGPAADCVRSILSASPSAAELPPFSALRERRQRRSQRQLVVAAVLSAAALLIFVRAARHDDEAISVRAELAVATSLERSEPSTPAKKTPETAQKSEPAEPAPTKAEREISRPRVRAASRRVESRRPLEVMTPSPELTRRSARACAELARGGAPERALSCYRELASGDGITAELALFEQARLEGKALRRPEQALRTLDAYRQRFPNGSLRAEVMLAQIDWLLRAGDRARALTLVDQALASGFLPERRAELERLRTTLSPP